MQADTAMIDDRQRRRIFGAARGIGMDNDDLHALTADLTGKESLKALTAREAEALIRELQRRQPSAPPTPKARAPKQHPEHPGGPTSEQQSKVWAMMYDLQAMDTEPSGQSLGERLSGIIRKELHVSAAARDPFAWLTCEQCSRLIDILDKGYVPNVFRARQRGPKGGGRGGG